MSTNLEASLEEIRGLIQSMEKVHAAQFSPAHTVLSDQNLDREWIEKARYESSEDWEDYIAQRHQDWPSLSKKQIRQEVHLVFAVLERLLQFPDEVLALAEETYR